MKTLTQNANNGIIKGGNNIRVLLIRHLSCFVLTDYKWRIFLCLFTKKIIYSILIKSVIGRGRVLMGRNSFILYMEQWDLIELLPTDERGMLLTALFVYKQTGEIIEMPISCQLVFKMIINQMKRDDKKYEKTVERNRENGSKGGRPRKDELTTVDRPKPIDIHNPDIEACFSLYKDNCPALLPLKHERRSANIRNEVGKMLSETDNDLTYFKEVCENANSMVYINDYPIDFRSLVRNHISIANKRLSKQKQGNKQLITTQKLEDLINE